MKFPLPLNTKLSKNRNIQTVKYFQEIIIQFRHRRWKDLFDGIASVHFLNMFLQTDYLISVIDNLEYIL